ncbi:Phytochrome, two-component sensor histidine kinase (EC 2.7.3.-); Cyanobacterial phytochrome B [Methylomonas fluvii]|nr:Phytochrome, two-component sensor histidine kinase (EC 2.7.3.-); Cyanobacterial phytochrome B [Methylomonas fluvii]
MSSDRLLMITNALINRIKFLLLSCCLLASFTALADAPVRIGVLAYRPKPQTLEQWQALSSILHQAIPEREFVVEALNYDELEARVDSKQLDFLLTNPGHYVHISYQHSFSAPLATLLRHENGGSQDKFGGVIFARAERADLNALDDLRGKKIAATSQDSLGGFQMQAYEAAQAGIDIVKASQLVITGMPHDAVTAAVLSGQADIGFVRTGVLEDLAKNGKLDLRQIKILNAQPSSDFKLLSTALYPEWPFLAMPNVDRALAKKVAGSLFLMGPDHIPGIEGFTIPADYNSVEQLLRNVRAKPFDAVPSFTLTDIWQRYPTPILALSAGVMLVVLLSLSLFWVNRYLVAERRRVREQNIRLADSEYRWKFALEGADEGVWDWDIVSGEVFFSPRWKSMVGYQPDEFANNFDAWRASLHPDDTDRVLQTLSDYFDGKNKLYWVEFRMRCKDGRYKWILAKGMVVAHSPEGKPQRMLGTHVDIDKHKQIEQELRQSHDALLRSNVDLEQFAYSVSHDMRQPLRMVSGHLQFLERNLRESLDEDARQNLNFALEGAKRMDAMIVSLLEYSRVGRKTQQKSWIASDAIRDEVLQFVEPMAAQCQANIRCQGDWPILYASRDELSRLLQNLLVNALHYRQEYQAPIIDVNSEVGDGFWRLSVRDNGIGIDPGQFDRLFQFFSRLQARTRFEGTGMGLALCRRIIEHHNGKIWVDSAGEGQGSCFTFEIPLGYTPATDSQPA